VRRKHHGGFQVSWNKLVGTGTFVHAAQDESIEAAALGAGTTRRTASTSPRELGEHQLLVRLLGPHARQGYDKFGRPNHATAARSNDRFLN